MDRVCRTCMRIIDVEEEAVSLNDPDMRKQLEMCLPELVLDSVVDPKMCINCTSALSFSFHFKDMCSETDKTINNCLENSDKKQPLNDSDLLSLGLRASLTVDENGPIKNEALLEILGDTLDSSCKDVKDDKPLFVKRSKRIAVRPKRANEDDDYIYTPPRPRASRPKLSLKPVESLKSKKATDKTLEEMLKEITGELPLEYEFSFTVEEPKLKSKRKPYTTKPKTNLGPSIKDLEGIDLDVIEINDGGKAAQEFLAALSSLPVPEKPPVIQPKPKPKKPKSDEVDVAPEPARQDEKILFDDPGSTKTAGEVQLPQSKPSSLTCEHCGRIFKYISELNVHKRAHILFKTFSCELCGKMFSLERYLAVHMSLHLSAGNNMCQTCNKYFSSHHVLKKHYLTHTGEKPFACEICSRRFNQRVNLETHMRTHSGTKDYVCYVCNVAFGQKVHLITHMRFHTGERPYGCNVCSKRFVKSTELRYHKNSHIARPFMCSTCHALFKDDVSYQRHITRTRYDETHNTYGTCRKIFQCGVCTKSYVTKSSRDRHMQSHVKSLVDLSDNRKLIDS